MTQSPEATFKFSAKKRALLQSLLEQAGIEATPAERIPRRSEPGPVPLSFAQQRLWFLHQLEPESPAYNVPTAVRLVGSLQVELLARCLNEMVRRHEALRTSFGTLDGQPVQLIAPAASLELPLVELRAIDPSQREAEVLRLALAEASRPFDLSSGPLLRTILLRLDHEQHVLLLTIHHIVTDGWSTGILIRELATLYQAYLGGAPSPLPEPALQYGDFALWQRRWLQGELLERQLDYWRGQLGGELPVLQLPADHARSASQSWRGARCPLELPRELSQALTALSRQPGTTLFMTLLAAFKLLLLRYTGQDDILVGTPIANRNRAEIEGVVGFFVNTLVLRSDLSGDPSFRELLGRVQQVAAGAYAHQDLPFERLVEELRPDRDLSQTPLFQVMFALHNTAEPAIELPGLSVQLLEYDSGIAQFDFLLEMWETPEGLRGSFNYNADLFERATIERMAGQLRALLAAVAASPDQRISRLRLLSQAERQLLDSWNDTAAPVRYQHCLHQLFEAQVQRTPLAPALIHERHELRYAELNARANQLAHHLRVLGVGPEVRVGVCLERSPDLVVSLLAVLKAGGAYVPLDPAYPAERLAFMLEDAEAPVVLTEERCRALLPPLSARVICVDSARDQLAALPEHNPAAAAGLANLAYLIYTSGSTGRPKGVAITHGNAAMLLAWAHATFTTAELSGVLAATSVCFDLSVFELFVPLSMGGAVILADNALSLPGLPAAARVTLVNTVPSAINELLRMGDLPLSISTINLAGEPLPLALAQRIYRQTGAQRLYNLYGPSEDTTYSTYALIEPAAERAPAIGRPLWDTQSYLLDRQLQPVPLGVPGELYLSGAGLARGYLNRPALTAERFLPNPFSAEPGARMYRTGDLARYRADGQLEFLGRLDHQVKIRGFRIELGEIDTVLGQHPAIRESIVLAREDEPGDKRLVAYVVPHQPGALAIGELRAYLGEKLAEYMVPSAFVFLEALPLTPNGKVDRKALPAPDAARPLLSSSYAAPRTPSEELLADTWRHVLGIQSIGIRDNFFELGGHSLLATQLVSRLRKSFEVDLPLRALFEAPTIAELAVKVEQARQADPAAQAPPLLPRPRSGSLPLSFAQQRIWFLDQLNPGNFGFNIPVAVRVSGRLDPLLVERVLQSIVSRHETLRTSFGMLDGAPVQLIAADPGWRAELIDLRDTPAGDREALALKLAIQEFERPFDLAQAPLWRAALIRLGDDEHILMLTIHHIIADAWSIGVLVQEIVELYRGLSGAQAAELPELPIQYADFAAWQRQWLQGPVLEAELDYWQRQLADAPMVLELPTDHPRPATREPHGAIQSRVLPRGLAASLEELSRKQGATLFMTLLAAFNTLLYRYTGQDDILVGTPIANRNRIEIESLIGFFVNTLVMRTDLAGDPSFRELIGRVRKTALEAYAHQDLPFEELVDALQPERDLSHTPLFQVMFILQNAPMPAIDLPGLAVEALQLESGAGNYDLSLFILDMDEGLTALLEYNTDLFEQASINRMLDHFQLLLEGIVADPDQRISRLPLLASAERQLLAEWNDTAAPLRYERCLHRLFEAQVERTPLSTALRWQEQQLSYAQLNAQANQLAHHLRARGVGSETLVGIYLERTPALLVAILAVLKAGGAYVPLDPAYPAERLAFILEETQATLLLSQQDLRAALPESSPPLLCLEAGWPGHPAIPSDNLPGGDQPDQLAYVIYTSGSTGRPKGVAISHRSAATLLEWAHASFSPRQLSGVLAATSICFDLSVFELFAPLTMGGAVILADNALSLPGLPAAEQVTLINTVPSAMAELLRSDALPASAHTINLAGEPLKQALVEELYSLPSVQRIYNLYGPSEDTTYSTGCLVPRGDGRPPSIGRPLPNTQVYLLDAQLQQVPPGVPGELYLGSASLARGYLRRPALTAERFVPNPFSAEPGARMYRTGDLARYRGDGQLEFLGRLDHQVKIRGFRIELGEIEAALARHPAVRECVVLAQQDGHGEARLAAYVVPHDDAQQSALPQELRALLKGQLPEYMLPSTLALLEALPLTPNGKIDRKALAGLGQPERQASATRVAPRDLVELELVRIWEETLSTSPIGVRDNFFELGGHSLLAVRLLSRIQQRLGARLPMTALFQGSTVEQLALALRQNQHTTQQGALVTIQPAGSRRPFFCVHPAGGNVLCYAELARHLGPDQPFYGLQATGLDGAQPPHTRIEAMAAAYIEQLRTVQPEGPYLLGGWSMGGIVAFEMAQQLQAQGQQVALLALLDAVLPDAGDEEQDELGLLGAFALDLGLDPEQLAREFVPAQAMLLSEEQQLSALLEQARAAGVIPPGIEQDQLGRLLAVFKANARAMQHYRPQRYPGKITLIRASELLGLIGPDTTPGWIALAGDGLEQHMVPGNHYSFVRAPHVQQLAAQLSACLLAAQSL